MRNCYSQIPIEGIYEDVTSSFEKDKPEFLQMIEDYIDFETLIPYEFNMAFYRGLGRPREYSLEGFIRFFVLQKVLGVSSDSLMLKFLSLSMELRKFCGFVKVPDAPMITRFRQDFVGYINAVFDRLVDITEPICREISKKKADYLIYDTTGIEAYVAENNPKFLNAILSQCKKIAKSNNEINPYALAYSKMPETANANPFVRQQYANGHFCYAHKAGILTNGLGIVRDIAVFDDGFKFRHPEAVSQKTDNPDLDKEVGDSTSLKPVLEDFFKKHPGFSYKTFIGDSSFDSYDNFEMLRDVFHFERVAVPMNKRNSSAAHKDYNEDGVPVCPIDRTPFTYIGPAGGRNRSQRFKWVCHKSKLIHGTSSRLCSCLTPCTCATGGRYAYTSPNKDFRLCPGIARGTVHWDNLYRHRVVAERTINLIKDPYGVADRKSFSVRTAKADLLFACITQLIGVVIAHAIKKPELYKSIRKLIA